MNPEGIALAWSLKLWVTMNPSERENRPAPTLPLAFLNFSGNLRLGKVMDKGSFIVLLVEDNLNDIFLVKRAF